MVESLVIGVLVVGRRNPRRPRARGRDCSSCSTPSASRCRTTGSSLAHAHDRRRDARRRPRDARSRACAPRFRSTRVPPIAAVREGATLPPGRFARFRLPAAIVLTLLGFAALAYGLFGKGLGTTKILALHGPRHGADLLRRRRCSRRASRGRSRTCSAGPRRRSAAPPERSRATTPSATRSAPRRRRPR